VVTRFVAACPPVYWAMAWLWERGVERGETGAPPPQAPTLAARLRRALPWLLAGYCVGYTAVGAALFSSFYNWT
jgi:hypothetical protein